MKLLGLDGTMVLVGLPEGAISVGPFSLTSARRSLAGSAFWGDWRNTRDARFL